MRKVTGVYRCALCNTVFKVPKRFKIAENTPYEDIVLECPVCGDDRITYIWDEPHEIKEMENKTE